MPVDGPYQINFDGQSGGCLDWKDCGLKINFPSQCSQQHVQVAVSAFLPINNEVHPGVYIVSAVYKFHCNIKRFDKPFTLRLQHCIELQSMENCYKMYFIVQHEGDNIMKYGHFEPGYSYGTVTLKQFCRIFIIWVRKLWKNICAVIFPSLDDQGHSSLEESSNQQSSTCTENVSQSDHPVYKYEAMLGLPSDHFGLTDWSSVYAIYVKLGEWTKVCMYIAMAIRIWIFIIKYGCT